MKGISVRIRGALRNGALAYELLARGQALIRELQELASRRAAAIAHNATEDEIAPGAPTDDFSDQVRAARPRLANDTPVEEEHSAEEMAAMDEDMADEPASPDTYDDVDQPDEPARNEEDEERN